MIHNPSDIDFLQKVNNQKPTKKPPRKISEYVEGRRKMPPGSPIPGPVRLARSYHAVEIMDLFSPYDPTRYIDMMAAAQTIKTFIIECVLGYGMDSENGSPCQQMYVSGTDGLLDKFTKRLEPLISSLGIRHLMTAQNENSKSRKTGDKSQQKMYSGGWLEMASASSPSSQRSESVERLFVDEANAVKAMTSTGEGRWDKIIEARTKSYELRRKIGFFTTPTGIGDQDVIYRRFLLGDQCYYEINCPMCGKPQFLEPITKTHGGNHGIMADYKAGDLQSVYYLCQHCHDAIFETSKTELYINGIWRPTAKAEPDRRSFQINSLYSPIGAYSWKSYYLDYIDAVKSNSMQTFMNLMEGLPYREPGSSPDRERIKVLQGSYNQKTVPDHILWLTMAVDVQRGSEKDPNKPPRLEFEVLGHSTKYRTASICYEVIDGAIDDPFAGAWEKLFEWGFQNEMIFYTRDGFPHRIQIVLIDSGDGKYNQVVYEFCERWKYTFPCKGFGKDGIKEFRNSDKYKGDGIKTGKHWRFAKMSEGVQLCEIDTNYYKSQIYNNLFRSIRAIEDNKATSETAGFMDFPTEYKQKYYDGLTAEEKLNDGTFKPKTGTGGNEPLDVKVYNYCGGDVYLDMKIKDFREWAKKQKVYEKLTQREIDFMIDKKFVLIDIEKHHIKKLRKFKKDRKIS